MVASCGSAILGISGGGDKRLKRQLLRLHTPSPKSVLPQGAAYLAVAEVPGAYVLEANG
ncbi:hypothetical protein RHRU231_620022 [Rhodococcus ruber]|uniref:Uncharacterized protein n=1 Tax=Rhodococcus ruber TaxID=1830 RepID=A0A098BQX9_9NOCA|nr:hypothetical protein RHRU231_620022 [Rhodococcus ruber]